MKAKKIISLWNLITCVFLTIVFTGALSGISEQKVYILVAIYFVMYILYLIIMRDEIQIDKFIFIISCIMISVWVYGIILGLLNGNRKELIIRNFAGMTMYLLVFPLSNKKIDRELIIKIIKVMAHYSLYISIFTYCLLTYTKVKFVYQVPVINAFVGDGRAGGFIQYFNRELIHVCFAYNAYIFLFQKRKKIISALNIVMAGYYYVIVNDSDGDLLAALILLLVVIVPMFLRLKKEHKAIIGGIVICILIGCMLINRNVLFGIFSPDDFGNARRYEELNYFKSNITFFGYGLGKELGSIGAAGIYNYGTELIYVNLFHKFGIFAILILGAYIATMYKAIKFYIKDRTDNPDKVIPMALMAYLIPSLANPMLFSVLAVVSHILSCIFISEDKTTIKIRMRNSAN